MASDQCRIYRSLSCQSWPEVGRLLILCHAGPHSGDASQQSGCSIMSSLPSIPGLRELSTLPSHKPHLTNAILSSQSTTANCKVFDAEICRRLEPILQCLVIETSPPPSLPSALHCRRTVQDLNISIMTHIVIRHTSSPHRYKTLPDFEFHQRSNGKYC